MTIKELKEIIEKENIPDDAQVYICADHGQREEKAHSYSVSRSECEYYGDGMIWEVDNMEEYYDKDALDEYNKDGEITSLLIGY
jgi:hypothetical protein